MDLMTTHVERFESWSSIRSKCKAVGVSRLLNFLIMKAMVEVDENDGVFIGNGLHNYLNHHVLCRLLILMIIEEGIPYPPGQHSEFSTEELKVVVSIFGQLNDRYDFTEKFIRGKSRKKGIRNKEDSAVIRSIINSDWKSSLNFKHRNNSSKFEIARAWMFFRHYWKKVSNRINVSDHKMLHPMNSAFEAIHYELLLLAAIERYHYYIPNPKIAFQNTDFSTKVLNFIDIYIPDAVDVVTTFKDAEKYPFEGLESPFLENPIIKLPNGSLIAPEPGLLFCGIEDRFFRKVQKNFQDDDYDKKKVRTIFGYIFEEHVCFLVKKIAEFSSHERFLPEFKYDGNSLSPECFILGKSIFSFEAKFKRFPIPSKSTISIKSYFDWVNILTGKKDGRPPLYQGINFFDRWSNGHREILQQLGKRKNFSNLYYLVVSSENIPATANWFEFRNNEWGKKFDIKQKSLDKNTWFISIRDLEILASYSEQKEISFELVFLDWIDYWSNHKALVTSEGKKQFKMTFRDFLVKGYPELANSMLTDMKAHLDEYYNEVEDIFT
jgi:hypothetical protein